jgi:hypothetical protein
VFLPNAIQHGALPNFDLKFNGRNMQPVGLKFFAITIRYTALVLIRASHTRID